MISALKGIKLKPEEVSIDGISKKIPVHRFSLHDWENDIAKKIEGKPIEVAVLYLLHPLGYEHSIEDLEQLKSVLGVPEIIQLYRAGLRINGCAVEGGEKDAKKD
ncbi:hypothetical protein TDB9533_01231 [Thalassocella blandensis]|nr:hypothetical protein TDB9533_01231 [Thalassocella blandensis]